jgi:drug/metabolite transporter (DMT)-like permease
MTNEILANRSRFVKRDDRSSMSTSSKPPFSPFIVLGFGILAVSTASILIRFAQQEAPSIVIAAYRLSLAALILAPFGLKRSIRELRGLNRGQICELALSGLFLAFHFAAWITSLEMTSIASSVVLVTTTPLWVAIFSPLILGERSRREVWIGLSLAILGGSIVGLKDACQFGSGGITCQGLQGLLGGRALFGNFLALFGAWMAAGYMIAGRRIRPHFSLVSYTLIVYGVSAFFLMLFVLISRQPLIGYPPETFLWFLLLALIPQILGHSSFNWALRYLPAAFVSLALLGEPVGTTILAVLILRENPTWVEIAGGALILTGIYLASRRENGTAGRRSSGSPEQGTNS